MAASGLSKMAAVDNKTGNILAGYGLQTYFESFAVRFV